MDKLTDLDKIDENLNGVIEIIQGYVSLYGLRILGAIVLFFIGRWVVKAAVRFAGRLMDRAKIDPTLRSFGGNILYALGMTFVILAVLGQIGVETASLIAMLGAAGLAVGLALQGSLSNFAAGVMIILFRPFRVGHYIEAGGVAGTVHELNIFTTRLLTFDNKVVIVPNANITSGNIINYNSRDTRRLDMVFGISYEDDLRKAKNILKEIVEADPRVLKDPATVIAIGELADNSVNIYVRPWVPTAEYWDIKFDVTEKVKLAFDEKGISIPYPQRQIHITQASASDNALQ